MFQAHLAPTLPSPGTSHFSEHFWFFLVGNDITDQGQALAVLIASGIYFLPGTFISQR